VLDELWQLPDGTQMLVEGEAQDIVRRLREGDPGLGWEGDREMRVFVVEVVGVQTRSLRHRFEAWTLDEQREPYCAATAWEPLELIHQLHRNDTRRRDVVEEALKKAKDAERAQQAEASDRNEELADKLHFALVKENTASGRRIF
jgi:hypothetical protein